MIDSAALYTALTNFYTKEVCQNLYEVYLKNWIADGYIGEKLSIFDLSMVDKRTGKEFYIDLLFEIFSDEKKFNQIYETFPKDVQKLFEKVIWEDKILITDEKEKEFYFELKNTYYSNKLAKRFQFFREELSFKGRKIFINENISKILRLYFKQKPLGYYLEDSTDKMEKEKRLYKDNNEKEFINNLSLYLDFSRSGAIKMTSTGKIMKDTKKNMLKHCNITEYYGDLKNLDLLKTENLCMFFELLDRKYQNETYFNTTNIKDILLDFISTKNHNKDDAFPYTVLFLNYLKGVRNIWEEEENLKGMAEKIMNIIKNSRVDICVSIENLYKSFIYREPEEYLISPKAVADYLYISEASSERTRITNTDYYRNLILMPFIKSYLFLLGTLGIFELYYTEPENSRELYMKNGYLTPYDGLKYIKLTNLGKYVLGFEERYSIPITYEKSEIFLDDKRLIVTMTGESPARKMYFEKVAQRISANIYKITLDSFKKGIKNSHDLKERIENFKKNTNITKLPRNWKVFFDDLVRKFNSIKEDMEYFVWKIKEDRELLEIIKKDSRIKNLTLKAENYFLLVHRDNREEVKKIFKEYGYHVNEFDDIFEFEKNLLILDTYDSGKDFENGIDIFENDLD